MTLPFQPFERLLTETQRLYLEFPPSTLEKDVKERYRRYREQMQPPKKKRPSKTVRIARTMDICFSRENVLGLEKYTTNTLV